VVAIERAAIVLVEVGGHRLEAVDLGERTVGVLEHLGALRRHARKRPPLAHEQIESELPFESLECATDRGLRGAESCGGLRDRQAVPCDGHRVLQLVKIHGRTIRPNGAANHNDSI